MAPNSNDIITLGTWLWNEMGAACWTPTGKSAMGYIDDRDEVGWAVVYENHEPLGSVHMHMAIADPKSISRRAISAVFEYPFEQLRVKKVIGIVNSQNQRALDLDMRLGFKVEAVIKDAYEKGDMYILSMTRQGCRWL